MPFLKMRCSTTDFQGRTPCSYASSRARVRVLALVESDQYIPLYGPHQSVAQIVNALWYVYVNGKVGSSSMLLQPVVILSSALTSPSVRVGLADSLTVSSLFRIS